MRPKQIENKNNYPLRKIDDYIFIKSKIRGLFNDLTRSLLASAIYMDDLSLQIEEDSEAYYNWWNVNTQINQAIKYYLELKDLFYDLSLIFTDD